MINKRRKKETTATRVNMSIADIGENELEGITSDPEVVIHADNRATLIRKAQRELREKHNIPRPVVMTKVPSGKCGHKF